MEIQKRTYCMHTPVFEMTGSISLLVVVFLLLFAGCREEENPSSSTTPPPTNRWDSLGLAGSSIQSIATDGRRIFVGTSNGFYRSLDSGATWLFSPTINSERSFSSVAISGPNVLVGTDTSLFISSNDGVSWSLLISPLTIHAMARGQSALFAATTSGMIRSTNNGLNWTYVNTGLPAGLPAFKGLAAETTTVVIGLSNAVYVSGNDAEFWSQVQVPWTSHTLTDVFINRAILYASTTGGLYTSRTQGTSWILAAVSVPDTSQVVGFAAIKSTVYAGTNNAGVFSSANGGVTWLTNNYNLPDLQITALASGGGYLYAGTRTRGLWRFTR